MLPFFNFFYQVLQSFVFLYWSDLILLIFHYSSRVIYIHVLLSHFTLTTYISITRMFPFSSHPTYFHVFFSHRNHNVSRFIVPARVLCSYISFNTLVSTTRIILSIRIPLITGMFSSPPSLTYHHVSFYHFNKSTNCLWFIIHSH